PVAQASSLALTKSATPVDLNGDTLINTADRINWSFLVRNTGTTTITALAIADPRAGTVTCPVTTLAPGAQTTCTAAPYVVTSTDVQAGSLTNTATAGGQGPGGVAVTSAPSSTTTPINQSPALTVTKLATVTDVNGNGVTDLGDRIAYTFTVRNVGNVTLNTVTVNDPRAGAVTCASTALALGASTTCAATNPYVITQADVDAGVVPNTAQGRARSPLNAVAVAPNASTSTPVTQTTGMTLTKTAAVTDVNGNGATDRGDRIAWSFVVRNTGTVTLTSVGVTDPRAGTVTCPATTLAPNAQTTCTATAYTVAQADVDAGVVSNSATSAGRAPQGATVTSNVSTTDTPVAQAPAVSLTKTGAVTDLDGNGTDLGDTIRWSFTVTNTGTVTLTSVAVNDPLAGSVTCAASSLAPGASTTCTSDGAYAISQPNVEAGQVVNTATASGQGPTGTTVTSPSASSTTPVPRVRQLALVKSVASVSDPNGNGRVDAGEVVTYSFAVTNTGTVAVNALTINDSAVTGLSCPVTTLAPGASTTCTATRVVNGANIDFGSISNTATASGTSSAGPVTSPASSVTRPIARQSVLTVQKGATPPVDANANGRIDAGDTIQYSIRVRNSGNTSLSGIVVTDPRLPSVTCPLSFLQAGGEMNCTSPPYVITQADVDAGVVDNTAAATATSPTGPLSETSSTSTPLPQQSALAFSKGATVEDVNTNGVNDIGDRITWTFTVTNTGTVTVTNLTIEDAAFVGPISCVSTTLAPGATTTCASDTPYTIVTRDAVLGSILNTARAVGQRPDGGAVASPRDQVSVPVQTIPTTVFTKTAAVTDANGNGVTDLGDTIAWSFEVLYRGVWRLDFAITDPRAGAVTCPVSSLTTDETTTCTAAPYAI
ncbi:MAG: beta strand repeat-containing protein, partial [Dermatophilaceae bacterium]